MTSTKFPVKAITVAAEFIGLAAVLWMLRGYLWPTLSNVEVATLQAMLDPTLFRHDFVVQECLRFTPRFYFNQLILLPAHAGIPLAWVFAAGHFLALGGLVAGLRSLIRASGAGAAAAAVFVVWALNVTAGQLGGVFLYTQAPVPAVWAGAVAVCGLAAAQRGRWGAAYACFGGAALLQFLVGFYAGLLLLPALWRARGLLSMVTPITSWVAGLALVYVPLRLDAASDSFGLPADVFIEIYAQLRHPHHLVPSSWSWAAWTQAAVFYAGGCWCCRRLGPPPSSAARWMFNGVLVLTGLLLLVNYLGVEVWPSVLVAKLQPARATPFAQLAMLAALAGVLQSLITRRNWVGATLVALAPLSPFPGFLLLLAAVLLPEVDSRRAWPLALLAIATVLSFWEPGGPPPRTILLLGTAAASFLALLVPSLLARRPAWLTATCTLGAAGAWACAAASTTPAWPRPFSQLFSIEAAPFDVPGFLGRRFESITSPDAIVLAPVTDTWTFKLFARRALVVDDKNFPFTDSGIAEWGRRMSDVLGTPYVRGVDAEAAWAAQSPARLAATAARYGARYVLTRDRWHPALAGRRIDRLHDWSVWELSAMPPKTPLISPSQ